MLASAEVGAGGGPQAAAWGAGLDAEEQMGLLMSLLYDHRLPGCPEPPGLDAQIYQGLQAVMAMPHNRALARRVHSETRIRATKGENDHQLTLAAARVQVDNPTEMQPSVHESCQGSLWTLSPLFCIRRSWRWCTR